MNTLIKAALVALFTASAPAAFAQVESHISGTWNMQKAPAGSATVFELSPDGRYRTTVNGQVVETGKMTQSGNNWSLRSDTGREDSGTLTSASDVLGLHGKQVATFWERPGARSNRAAAEERGASTNPNGGTPVHTLNGVVIPAPRTQEERNALRRNFARNGGWLPGAVPHRNDQQARKFWKGH